MDRHERLLPSSPTLHAVEARTAINKDVAPASLAADEYTPLLSETTKSVEVVEKNYRPKNKRIWSWRTLALVTVLWFTVLFVGAAYSMIAPFFPQQVAIKGQGNHRGIQLSFLYIDTLFTHPYSHNLVVTLLHRHRKRGVLSLSLV